MVRGGVDEVNGDDLGRVVESAGAGVSAGRTWPSPSSGEMRASMPRSRAAPPRTAAAGGKTASRAGRLLPERVRQLGHLVAGPLQVRGPRQHALEDRLAAVGELPDHRDVALGPPDDRVADRGPVTGVSVRVQEQVEPLVPAGRVTESG